MSANRQPESRQWAGRVSVRRRRGLWQGGGKHAGMLSHLYCAPLCDRVVARCVGWPWVPREEWFGARNVLDGSLRCLIRA